MSSTDLVNKNNVVIIGGGLGGLSLGVRLNSLGMKVVILEKNEKVGGHASQLKKGGFTFDMGPSIITETYLIEELFRMHGKSMSDYLDLLKIDPFYRINYSDGSVLDYSGDSARMKSQLSDFNAADGAGYDRFIKHAGKIYNEVFGNEIGARPFSTWKDVFKFAPKALLYEIYQPPFNLASKYFKDPRSQFAFSFHPLFLGGNPFFTSSIFAMISYLEKVNGVWYAKGGMYSLVLALEELFKETGGQVLTNTEVTGIEFKGRKAVGVYGGSEYYKADIVVSNAHFAHTYKDLISPQLRKNYTDRRILKKQYSMSAFLLYLGTKKQYDELPHHSIILSPRYKLLIDDIFKYHRIPKDFSIYAHVPSRSDPSMAPSGKESMCFLVPVPNLLADYDWSSRSNEFADKVIDHLENNFGLKDLRKNIEVQEVFTPIDFEQKSNNHLGAAWSLEPSFLQIAHFRPHNKSDEFDNLYLVGASTHPGAGVPGVMLGAKATEFAMKKDLGTTDINQSKYGR